MDVTLRQVKNQGRDVLTMNRAAAEVSVTACGCTSPFLLAVGPTDLNSEFAEVAEDDASSAPRVGESRD